jgi:hypothetical protein
LFFNEGRGGVAAGTLPMATILPFLRDQNVFDPKDIVAMSIALDDISEKLKVGHDSTARAVLAARIIDLARLGERDPIRLCNRVIHEAKMAD